MLHENNEKIQTQLQWKRTKVRKEKKTKYYSTFPAL